MSLILDALRKSEAERRRGQLPALTLELPPAASRSYPARAWWLAVPIGVALAALAIWFMRPAGDSPLPDTAQPATAAQTTSPDTPPAEALDNHVEVGAGAAAEGFERAMDGARPALVAGRGLVPANPSAVAPAPPPEAAPAPITQAPATATDIAPASTSQQIFELTDLTPDERRALPPLKLSMHLWSEDPARRFVIVDGHRLGEGDRAGNAIVERIDPTGVILAADGRRIRLPLP